MDGDELVYHDYCDISIAVSAPKGLVVPIIRNAESLSMADIEKKVVELATKARDNKLSMEEMQGGTFTITNGGVFGSLMSTPIINIPQSAILGMHKIEDRAVVVGGQVVVRPMMYPGCQLRPPDHRRPRIRQLPRPYQGAARKPRSTAVRKRSRKGAFRVVGAP
ncbi:2-oxo acid dehydrogenase subunit E2 [Puia sp. P3]|uniref:2-oxo acid dehydrogenase subunit E2 n=1 Tax=Puia sp. P3 TaxID=3423952 RepID=UPI003D67F317